MAQIKLLVSLNSVAHTAHLLKYTDLRRCVCIYVYKGENCLCVLTSWQHQRVAVYVNIGHCPTDDSGLLQAFSTFPKNYACVHEWLMYNISVSKMEEHSIRYKILNRTQWIKHNFFNLKTQKHPETLNITQSQRIKLQPHEDASQNNETVLVKFINWTQHLELQSSLQKKKKV